MNISRRNFLGALSASVTAGIALTGSIKGSGLVEPVLGTWTVATPDALSQLGWGEFYQYVGTDFEFGRLQRQSRSAFARLTLTRMVDTTAANSIRRGREPKSFLLTFKSPAGLDVPKLDQDTYSVDHFGLGSFNLFISDADVVDGDYVYTAVINRVTE